MEYHSAIKHSELPIQETMGINLQIMLSEEVRCKKEYIVYDSFYVKLKKMKTKLQ